MAHHRRLKPLELVTAADPLLAAVDLDQLGGRLANDGGLHPRRELGRDRSGQRQPGQVEILAGGDLGSRLQGRHLAIAGIEQPDLTEHGANAAIERQIQRVVGGVSGMDIAGQEQPGGLGDGGHELELGQVGAVVLAVAELHQSVVGDGVIATTGGGIESDPVDGQGIDVTVGLPEVGFQSLPDFGVGQSLEDQGQAVVGELDGSNRLSQGRLEGVLESLSPGLDGRLAVVGAGEDVSDPDGDEPSVGESLVERVGWEMAVEDLGELELGEESQEQGHVIDTLVGQLQGVVHGGSPTRVSGKPSLYRVGRGGEKIQVKEREYGDYVVFGLRCN